jgi:hypothetical protein
LFPKEVWMKWFSMLRKWNPCFMIPNALWCKLMSLELHRSAVFYEWVLLMKYVCKETQNGLKVTFPYRGYLIFRVFFPLALQPQFGPWPTSMKLSVSLRFSRS